MDIKIRTRMNYNTNSLILLVFILVFLPCLSLAQAQRQYDFDSIQIDNDKLRYGMLKPLEVKENMKYPLVLTLHGGEWYGFDGYPTDGSDIFPFLFDFDGPYDCFNLAHCWLNKPFHKKYPAYIVVPHIYGGMNISTSRDVGPWDSELSVKLLNSLIDSLISKESIDTNRIYLTGHSIGGAGTLMLPQKLDKKPAALVPCSQAVKTEQLIENKVKAGLYDNVAMWYFHPRTELDVLGNIFDYLQEQGASTIQLKSAGLKYQDVGGDNIMEKINNRHRYFRTEYIEPYPQSGAHKIMEYVVQDTLLYKWLFKQYLLDEKAIYISKLSATEHLLEWNIGNPNDSVELWFREDENWQLLVKDKFVQNNLTLTDYIPKEKFEIGYLKICCINSEGFVYGLDECKISEINTSNSHANRVRLEPGNVYPNPFKNYLKVEKIHDLKRCKLYNLMGKKIIEQTSGYIQTSELEQGIYFLSVERDNGIIETTKVIKE